LHPLWEKNYHPSFIEKFITMEEIEVPTETFTGTDPRKGRRKNEGRKRKMDIICSIVHSLHGRIGCYRRVYWQGTIPTKR